MTDEREAREQETAPTDGASAPDLPTPAEDRSATADIAAAAGGDRPEDLVSDAAAAAETDTGAADEGPGAEDEAPAKPEVEEAVEPEPEDMTAAARHASAESDDKAAQETHATAAAQAEDGAEATAEPAAVEEARPERMAGDETAEESSADLAGEPPTADAASAGEDDPVPAADPEAQASEPEVSAKTPLDVPTERALDASAGTAPSPEAVPDAAPETAPEPRTAASAEPVTEQVPAAGPEALEDPALAELRRAKEEGTTVEGKVIGWNRGGFHVVLGETTAFCPSSEMELGRPRNPQSYVDRTLSFRVVKFQKKGRRVVLSRAAVLGEERQRVVSELAPGAVVRGRVTSLPDFGAFVDLGGVEGLVHVSEISRGRVKTPKDALEVGQEVEVKVLKVEQDGERISLSMKDLEPDPWQGVAERYPRGVKVPGKVARRADFGLFVELEPEVEGLVHVSQLPPGTELSDPSLDPGKEIEVWVREVDRKRQRISLSLREIPSEDPWKEATKRFPEGEMVEGTVESIAPFGVFVNLAPGLTGLLPGSQTGLPKGTSAARAFSPGQKVRVQVLAIDTRRKRISLGREGSRVEATRGDLQDFKKQQREREQEAPTAMAAAFARLREEREGSEKS